ncbi:MAG TPA: hypothetical protein VM285_10805, partial [Polyangia bacterium]|nr:hypothetical protein [Polyangia bacterium]
LGALTAVDEGRLQVGLFQEAPLGLVTKMDRDLLFALAAICQHENLSISELREVLNVPLDFAAFAGRYLTEYQLVEAKHTDERRLTLAPQYYPQVIKALRAKHLLFEME